MLEKAKWYFKAMNREYKSAYTQNNFFRNPFKEKKNNNSLVLKVAKAYLLLAEKKSDRHIWKGTLLIVCGRRVELYNKEH